MDAGIRGGYLAEVYKVSFPHTPGVDVAGTIAEIEYLTAGTSAIAALVVVPYYSRPSEGAVVEHFAAVAGHDLVRSGVGPGPPIPRAA